ncbi:hypothetical protein JXA32_12580 [Candidatus Sumerlaeota bacterium]|nr:hypothetical protein [Candidatus Sumerlaeota bacterium]
MKISEREKKLLMLCAVVVFICGVGILMMVGGGEEGKSSGFDAHSLDKAKSEYEGNLRLIDDAEKLAMRLKKIREFIPKSLERGENSEDPRDLLPLEVTSIYQDFGIAAPRIEPPRSTSIAGSDQYKWLELQTNFQGPYEQVCNLLKAFDRNGFFIEDMRINNTIDQDALTVKLTLQKLVPLTPAEQRRRQEMMDRKRQIRGGGVR